MNKLFDKLKHNIGFVIFIIAVSIVFIDFDMHINVTILDSDGYYYYRYLPDIFINNHLGEYNKYPIGVAMLSLPIWTIFHVFACIFTPQYADGYSIIYDRAMMMSGLVCFIIGVSILYCSLKIFFNKNTSLITCIFITCGTAIPVYATFRSSFSHIYSFMAINLFCYIVIKMKLENKKTSKAMLALGVVYGIVTLLRNINAIVLLFYVLWGAGRKGYIKELKSLINTKCIAIFGFGFSITFLPQIIIWYVQTGKILINSYDGEFFSYLFNPKIIEVLFSDAKGLFIFAPILIFSVFGLIISYKDSFSSFSKMTCSISVILIAVIYTYASWWCWWLAFGYGHRGFVDWYGLFSLAMGLYIERVLESRKKSYLGINGLFAFLSIYLSASYIVASALGMINVTMSSWSELKLSITNSIEYFKLFIQYYL